MEVVARLDSGLRRNDKEARASSEERPAAKTRKPVRTEITRVRF